MKYILKVYCCKEGKYIKHDLKNSYKMHQVLLLFLSNQYKIEYHTNEKSETLRISVDEESSFKWLLNQINKILNAGSLEIKYTKREATK